MQKNKFKIFLGSLPPKLTNKKLRKILSEHGQIKSVHLIFDKKSGYCKGYGHIIAGNKSTSDKILSSEILIEGRKIFKEPFLKGKKLLEKKERFISKRIFVTNLDLQITDFEIKKIFTIFGEVEQAYRIVSCQGKKQPYGFVLFKDSQSADDCNNAKQIHYKGNLIYFRFFVDDDEAKFQGKRQNQGKRGYKNKKNNRNRLRQGQHHSNKLNKEKEQPQTKVSNNSNANPRMLPEHNIDSFNKKKFGYFSKESHLIIFRNNDTEVWNSGGYEHQQLYEPKEKIYVRYHFKKNEWRKSRILEEVEYNHGSDNLRLNKGGKRSRLATGRRGFMNISSAKWSKPGI